MSRILILGGDGYLGWPTAMYFSDMGHEVVVVDNYYRRQTLNRLDIHSLYPIPDLIERAEIWLKKTDKLISVFIADLQDSKFLEKLFTGKVNSSFPGQGLGDWIPDAIIHFAEQPSAPYSLASLKTADETLVNNLRVTNNVMWAIKDFAPNCHLIKLGTMGEYGTPNIDIEEGWINIKHKGREDTFLFPRQASSIYHTSKIMDTDLLWFGCRTWNLRVTDLMQGPVYGVYTSQTRSNPTLLPIFNYDEIFGTVINRFVVQAAIQHPLTVYGSGGQTRGYINLEDVVQCVGAAFQNPAHKGELKIYNQITETFTVLELAERVRDVSRDIGINVEIDHVQNPREESESHYYNPKYSALTDLGVTPHRLTSQVLGEMLELVLQYKEKIEINKILMGVKW